MHFVEYLIFVFIWIFTIVPLIFIWNENLKFFDKDMNKKKNLISNSA